MVKLLIIIFILVAAAGGAYFVSKGNFALLSAPVQKQAPVLAPANSGVIQKVSQNPVQSKQSQNETVTQPLTVQNADQSLQAVNTTVDSDLTQLDKDLQSLDQITQTQDKSDLKSLDSL